MPTGVALAAPVSKNKFRKEVELKLLEKEMSKEEYAKLLKISTSTLYWRLNNFDKLTVRNATKMLALIDLDLHSVL